MEPEPDLTKRAQTSDNQFRLGGGSLSIVPHPGDGRLCRVKGAGTSEVFSSRLSEPALEPVSRKPGALFLGTVPVR